jgi:hypothetical protein
MAASDEKVRIEAFAPAAKQTAGPTASTRFNEAVFASPG